MRVLTVSYIVFALSSAVTNLSNKTLICHDFQGPTIKFHDFPGLENEILKFHDFPGFHDLYEPCNSVSISQSGLSKSCERRLITLQLILLDQQGQNWSLIPSTCEHKIP